MTPEQLTTLKAAILAETDATFVDYRNQGATGLMAEWLNQPTSPAFIVWRSSIPVEEYRDAITWTEVDGLTVGSKFRIWEWLTGNMTLSLESGKAAVRAGLADCWASNTTTRANLLVLAKRTATKAEKVFATGTGTTASPANLGFEGVLTADHVAEALSA